MLRYDGAVNDSRLKDRPVFIKLKEAQIEPQQLAEAIGVGYAAARYMLKAERGIPEKHFDKIAALLKISKAELFEGSDLPSHSPLVKARQRYIDAKAEADQIKRQYTELLLKATEHNEAMWELLNAHRKRAHLSAADHGHRAESPHRRSPGR